MYNPDYNIDFRYESQIREDQRRLNQMEKEYLDPENDNEYFEDDRDYQDYLADREYDIMRDER